MPKIFKSPDGEMFHEECIDNPSEYVRTSVKDIEEDDVCGGCGDTIIAPGEPDDDDEDDE